jgi:predicted MFS family arabinose efflux permease
VIETAWRTLVDPDERSRVLTLCVGAYFGVRLCQVIIGPVVPEIRAAFDVSRGSIGLALTGMWVLYALVQIPSGVFADRYGERTVVLATLLTTACATLAMALTPTFIGFGLAVAVVGVGAGIYYNPATALLDRTAGAVGRAIGVHRIGGQAAGIVAPGLVTLVGLRYGWREAVAVAGVSVLVVAVAFRVGIRSTEPRQRGVTLRELFDTRQLLGLLSRSHTRTTTVMMAFIDFAGHATISS